LQKLKEMHFDTFGKGNYVYVEFTDKSKERLKELTALFLDPANNTNIFIKNISKDVSLETIREAFSIYGG
jgi:RNA recognition motif-containing protein